MRTKRKLSTFVQGFIIINLLWYGLSIFMNLRVLPTPFMVYQKISLLYTDKIYQHILVSLYRVLSGLGIAMILGIGIGLLIAYSGWWNKLLNPLIYFTYPIPKTVLLPILMLLFGLGDSSKITLIVLIIIFQVIVSARDAVQGISQETYAFIHSLGASKYQIFIHVTLPAILPELLTNLRLSVGTALSILFFAEAYGTHYGIGYYILDAWSRMDYISMYLGVVTISLVGFALFIAVDLLEESVCKWKQ
ncbi:MAG: ABC transporter permease [Firmicutes bacterium HGW-Firmicutes-7]|nr:MAG: ABC transporter permease [Firmicutes bacterium HGW-Firmicutes-7]